MPITVSPKARENVPITDFGRNGMHYTVIFGNENKDNPTCCGLSIVRKAPEPNTFAYPCSVFFIVLEGELNLEDQEKLVFLKAGDVVRIDKGTVVKWTSPTQGKAFFVLEFAQVFDPEHHLV